MILGNRYCIGDEHVTDYVQGASTQCMICPKSEVFMHVMFNYYNKSFIVVTVWS